MIWSFWWPWRFQALRIHWERKDEIFTWYSNHFYRNHIKLWTFPIYTTTSTAYKKFCTRYSNRHKKNSRINFSCFDIFIFSITTCQTVHRFSEKVTKLFNKYSIEIWISQLNVIEFSVWMERYLKEHFLYWNWFSFPTNLNIYAAKKKKNEKKQIILIWPFFVVEQKWPDKSNH